MHVDTWISLLKKKIYSSVVTFVKIVPSIKKKFSVCFSLGFFHIFYIVKQQRKFNKQIQWEILIFRFRTREDKVKVHSNFFRSGFSFTVNLNLTLSQRFFAKFLCLHSLFVNCKTILMHISFFFYVLSTFCFKKIDRCTSLFCIYIPHTYTTKFVNIFLPRNRFSRCVWRRVQIE